MKGLTRDAPAYLATGRSQCSVVLSTAAMSSVIFFSVLALSYSSLSSISSNFIFGGTAASACPPCTVPAASASRPCTETAASASPPSKPQVSVVVIVPSKAESRGRRDLLRHQFQRNFQLLEAKLGKEAVQSVVIKYIIGREAEERSRPEAEEFGDILFMDCSDADLVEGDHDHPSSTTMKLMLGVAWAVDNYSFDYLFRLGDDAYLRIDYFMELVREGRFPKERFLLGYIMSQRVMYQATYDYPQGMGFVLTFDICEWIAMSSQRGLLADFFPEDGMVGRWMLALKVNKMDNREGFSDYGWRICSNKSVVIHKLPLEAWGRIDSSGLLNCTV